MKKACFVFMFFTTWLCSINVYAESYHDIDIDKVYSQSDWSSKDKIKNIIDDYSLLLQCKRELKQCTENENQLNCMDSLAQKIIQHFYNYNYKNNINEYRNYVKSALAVYGVAYCLNKYNIPSGTVCEQEKNTHTNKLIKQYIETLLSQTENKINTFSFIKDYK